MVHPIVHFEIGCRDSGRTVDFYSQRFDWKVRHEAVADYISTGGEIGGHITALGHEPRNYVTVCIGVDDVQAYLDEAVALGGKALLPVITIPTGQFSWFADPEGNIIGLFKENPK